MSDVAVPHRPGVHAMAQTIEGDLIASSAHPGGNDHTTQNLQVLQRFMAAIGTNDAVAVAEVLDPDITVTLHSGINVPLRLKARGAHDVLELIMYNYALLRDQQPELHSLTELGDSVLVMVRECGYVVATGEAYDVCAVQHYRFTKGRISGVVQIMAPRTV